MGLDKHREGKIHVRRKKTNASPKIPAEQSQYTIFFGGTYKKNSGEKKKQEGKTEKRDKKGGGIENLNLQFRKTKRDNHRA